VGNLRAVFLDVGGPLYPDENFLGAAHQAINSLRADRGEEPVEFDRVREIFDWVRNTEGASMRKSFAREFLGSEDAAPDLHRAIAPLWRHPEGTLYPDVIPFLEAVSRFVPIGIIANQESETKDALARDGVAGYISSWGLSALVGHEKPKPEIFHWALSDLGVEPADAIHIGNRFDTDVLPAHSLGLKTGWILRGEAPDHPPAEALALATLAAPTLAELTPLLVPLLAHGLPH
jgi:putative hydrolase of the HAD superfamily